MFKRIRLFNLRRKTNKRSRQAGNLREFIYLDEVSVTSLLSSRLGAIPSEFKEAVTSSMTAEVNGRIEADAIIAKSRLGSSIKSGQTTNHQVVRKATIQATFKDLYDKERGNLIIRPMGMNEFLPKEAEMQLILENPGTIDISTPWLVAETQLKRGALVELAVELQADPIFRASTVFSTVGNLFDKSELLKKQLEKGALNDINQTSVLFEQLMSGLIPIRCRLVDYVMITISKKRYLIHKNVLDKLPKASRQKTNDVYLTGVLEQELFWKDIRRVLFSKVQVNVLCRLNYDSIQEAWTPVKLVNILEEVAPDLAMSMNSLGDLTINAMVQGYGNIAQGKQAHKRMLVAYSEILAIENDIVLSNEDVLAINLLEENYSKDLASTLGSHAAFKAVTDYLSEQYPRKMTSEPEALLEMRERARQKSEGINEQDGANSKKSHPMESGMYLDAEVIAVYW